MGGPIFGRGIALMWALMCCRTQRREDQGSVMVGGEGKTITDVAQGGNSGRVSFSEPLSLPTLYLTLYRWLVITSIKRHTHKDVHAHHLASSPFDRSGSCEIDNY